jgi:K+ transporter
MVFLTPNLNGMPYLGKHAWLRSRARYERVVLLRLVPASQPSMLASERVEVRFVPESVVGPQRDVDPRSAARLVTVEARFGYMERLNIGLVIEACQRAGLDLSGDDVAFFYADPKIRALEHHGMPWFRRELFRFLNRAARRMPDDLGIAPERQVELGVEVAL